MSTLKPDLKDYVFAATLIFACGGLYSKINAQEDVVKMVPINTTAIAVLSAKVDYLTALMEYSVGITRTLPSKHR